MQIIYFKTWCLWKRFWLQRIYLYCLCMPEVSYIWRIYCFSYLFLRPIKILFGEISKIFFTNNQDLWLYVWYQEDINNKLFRVQLWMFYTSHFHSENINVMNNPDCPYLSDVFYVGLCILLHDRSSLFIGLSICDSDVASIYTHCRYRIVARCSTIYVYVYRMLLLKHLTMINNLCSLLRVLGSILYN